MLVNAQSFVAVDSRPLAMNEVTGTVTNVTGGNIPTKADFVVLIALLVTIDLLSKLFRC